MAEGTVQESRDTTRKPVQAGRESNLRSNPRLLGLEERFQLPTIVSLRTLSRGALRVARNYKGYSYVQAKVREATSNDPWGPSSTLMNEIAQMTYNQFISFPRQLRDLPSVNMTTQKRLFWNYGDAGKTSQ